MPTFAGLEFPDLPDVNATCSNWNFLDDDIGWSLDESNKFNEASNRYGELLNELNFKLTGGNLSLNDAADIFNNYCLYLINGIDTLEVWQNAYDDWANESSWFFNIGTNDSCNQTGGANEAAELFVQIIRNNLVSKYDNAQQAIQVFINQQEADVATAEWDAEIADLLADASEDDFTTDTNKQKVQVIKFGNYVEYIAIGGAILILAYMGYKGQLKL